MKIRFADNRKVFNWHDGNGAIPFLSFNMLDQLDVPNAYTTRYKNYISERGASEKPGDLGLSIAGAGEKGIRVAFMKDEDPAEARPVIAANLGVLAEQLGSDIDHVCLTNQQHTANVRLIKAKTLGCGAEEAIEGLGYWNSVEKTEPIDGLGYWNSVEKTEPIDGLVTNVPGACLAVYGADCPPVYIIDKKNHAIALVHAGWKGTLAKIPKVAVEMMIKEFGSNPADMYAAIGPSICENCYEMGDEVYDAFAEQWSKEDADAILRRHPSSTNSNGDNIHAADAEQYPDGKYHLDLWKANRMTLERCGIPRDHIEVTNICTCCNVEDFYSYRAHRMENEQVAMLVNAN